MGFRNLEVWHGNDKFLSSSAVKSLSECSRLQELHLQRIARPQYLSKLTASHSLHLPPCADIGYNAADFAAEIRPLIALTALHIEYPFSTMEESGISKILSALP